MNSYKLLLLKNFKDKEMGNYELIKLEKFETRDVKDKHVNGYLALIWRNSDKIIKHDPKMVYVTSVNSNEIKGPHLHTKRNSYFTCIHGKVTFIIKNTEQDFVEIELAADKPQLLFIPKGTPSAHINNGNEIGRILTLADIAWKPNDNEMKNISFSDYDWKKWNVNNN